MNLNQVTIPSTDVDKSVAFYTKLGLKHIVSASPKYARFACPDGTSTFSVHLVDNIQANGTIVYFECEDLDEKVLALIDKGVKFSLLPTDQPWLWREARLSDPDGNPIILFFGGENRLNPPWRIN